MMINYIVYPTTKESKCWQEAPKTHRALLAAKVTLVAAILFLLAGMGVGLYYSATSKPLFCILPATVGTPLIITCVASLILSSFVERIKYGKAENLSNKATQDDVVKILTEGKLKALHARYYKNNGGLKNLVRKGYLHPIHGATLAFVLEEYERNTKLMESYKQQPHFQNEIQQNRLPEEYNRARLKVDLLNATWGRIQNDMRQRQNLAPLIRKAKSMECQLIPTYGPMAPSAEARRWHDEEAFSRNLNLAARVLLITGMILLLAGIVVSCYFCNTTTYTFTNQLGEVFTRSNGIFSLFPLIFGGFFEFALGCGVVTTFFETNGMNTDDLAKSYVRDDRIFLLTQGSLQQLQQGYYQKNGGLKKFVRQGYLSISQANQLRLLLRQYASIRNTLKVYTDNISSSPLKTAVGLSLEEFTSYQFALSEELRLEAKWRDLQKEIQQNFDPSAITEKHLKNPEPRRVKKTPALPNRIQKSKRSRVPLNSLPNELQQEIFGYLLAPDLGSVKRVCKNSRDQVNDVFSLRAKEYGIELNNLPFFLKRVKELAKRGYVPKEYVVFHTRRKSIDAEATLRKILFSGAQDSELAVALGEALLDYTKKGKLDMVETLLKLGASLEVRNEGGRTPLLIAIILKHEAIAALLIEKGADVNALDHTGDSALIFAVGRNLHRIAKKILEKNTSSLDHPGRYNYTPLHWAAQEGHANMIQFLLSYNADKGRVNQFGSTPQQRAPRRLRHLFA